MAIKRDGLDDTFGKKIALADKILNLSNGTLLIKKRMLRMAIVKCGYIPAQVESIVSDGRFIYYNPNYILRTYKRDGKLVNRMYMHTILHCMFLHNFSSMTEENKYWDLATDIAVENIINEWNMECTFTVKQTKEMAFINEIKPNISNMNADQIYKYLLEHYDTDRIDQILKIFHEDDHSGWYQKPEEIVFDNSPSPSNDNGENNNNPQDNAPNDNPDGEGQNNKQNNDQGDNQDNNNQGNNQDNNDQDQDNQDDSSSDESKKSKSSEKRSGNENSPYAPMSKEQREKTMDEWKDIDRQMKLDNESFNKNSGDMTGSLIQNINKVVAEEYDYKSFLINFGEMHESMKLNPDEFDYIFYTYGMNMYGNIPLIEPLEYKDDYEVRELALVIDTSSSVQGEEVEAFVNKTYNILRTLETESRRFRVCIIQCDTAIQEYKIINNMAEMEEYMETFKLKGFGGTDFRPAFNFVDKLISDGIFKRLGGLIYFTDGYGTFPTKAPKYKSAVVFYKNDYSEDGAEVPSWAIKLVLDKVELDKL